MAETLPAVAPDMAELGGPRDCMLDGPCRQGPRAAGARGRSDGRSDGHARRLRRPIPLPPVCGA